MSYLTGRLTDNLALLCDCGIFFLPKLSLTKLLFKKIGAGKLLSNRNMLKYTKAISLK